MLSINKSTPAINELVQLYLFSKGCSLNGRFNPDKIPKYFNYINVDRFKRISFNSYGLTGSPVINPTALFSQDLDWKIFKVGNYLVHPTKECVHVTTGGDFTRRQVQFARNCMAKGRTPSRIFNGYTIRFSKDGKSVRVGCTLVTKRQLEEIYEAMV